MKKFIVFCIMLGLANGAFGAANVLVPKKADSVAKREASMSTTGAGASLLPTAAVLAANIMTLNQQQKALTAECEPTSREISFVNNMVKEWAIAGAVNPLAAGKSGLRACDYEGIGETYESTVQNVSSGITIDSSSVCFDTFSKSDARGAVWVGFPKAALVEYCTDGGALSRCGKNNRKKVTNMWTIFDMVDFDNADYTRSESSQAVALLQKASNCSGTKLAAKRLEKSMGFIQNTINNIGQPTNTADIMGAVQTIVGQSGGGALGNLTTVAAQFLDK